MNTVPEPAHRPSAEYDPGSDAALLAELAALPMPEPPPEVLAQWRAALAQLPPPTTANRIGPVRRPRRPRWLAATTGAGLAAAAAAGLVMLSGTSSPEPPGNGPDAPLALRGDQLPSAAGTGLATRQLGALADPARQAGCLGHTGEPGGAALAGRPVLGGRPVLLDGRPGVLLVLPGERPGQVRLLVVTPDCAAGAGAALARTTVGH